MTISDNACAFILQAAGCAAKQILEEEEANASSCAGRMAVLRVRRSVHKVYMCLGDMYF